MDPQLTILLIAVAGASALQSATGIGFGVIAGPVMLLVLNSGAAIQISIVLSFLIAAMLVPSLWRKMDRRLVLRLVGGSIAGLPIGLFVFMSIKVDLLKFLAGLSVLFTLIFVLRNANRQPASGGGSGRFEQLAIGAVSGAMSGSLAMPGPIPAAWMSMRSYDKDTVRATILTMFIFSYGAAMALQVTFAGVSMETLWQCLFLTPPTLLGVLCGHFLARRFTQKMFNRVLVAILAGTSLSLFLDSVPKLVMQ